MKNMARVKGWDIYPPAPIGPQAGGCWGFSKVLSRYAVVVSARTVAGALCTSAPCSVSASYYKHCSHWRNCVAEVM